MVELAETCRKVHYIFVKSKKSCFDRQITSIYFKYYHNGIIRVKSTEKEFHYKFCNFVIRVCQSIFKLLNFVYFCILILSFFLSFFFPNLTSSAQLL